MSNRKLFETLAIIAVTATVLVFILISPLLVSVAADFKPGRHTWADLANVGQAFGGAAAVVSALALAGIAGSLVLQWRQTRAEQIFAIRERHFELVRLGIERPELIQALGARSDPTQAVIFAYASLWMGHWASHWDLGVIDEKSLRPILRDFFKSPQIREWWNEYGREWSSFTTAKRLRFVQIINHEWSAAVESAQTRPQA